MANDLVTVWGGVPRIGRAPASNELLVGNGEGFTLQSITVTIDNILGNTQGSIAYRSATQWTGLAPSTIGYLLQTNGTAANPSWVSLGTSFNNYFGTTTGLIPLRTPSGWGTISIGPSGTVFASDGSQPAWASLTNLFDVDFTTARQAIITRGASVWGYLTPTTTPNLLLTNNSGNASSDIGWTTLTGAIDNGTSGGSASIGQIIYRASTDYTRLSIGGANTILSVVNPGSGNVPAWQTPSDLFDSYFSSTPGVLITRDRNVPDGSGLWGAIAIGATNTILASGSGTGGNLPTWATISAVISAGTSGTTLQGDMLYFGSSALEKLNLGGGNTILTSTGTVPSWKTPSALFDSYFSSTPGAILTRDRNVPNGSGLWGALGIGASNTILASGAGTGGNLPTWASISAVLDADTSNTVGGILYRSSSGVWANSGSGASGYALVGQGSGNNPAWAKAFSLNTKSTSQSLTSSSSYSDDSDLQFSVSANSVYSFWGTMFYTYTTSGFDFAMNGPSGATIYVETLAGTNVSSAVAFDTVAATAPSLPSANTVLSVFFRGVLVTSSTAGTLVVRSKLQTGSTTSYAGSGSFMQCVKA